MRKFVKLKVVPMSRPNAEGRWVRPSRPLKVASLRHWPKTTYRGQIVVAYMTTRPVRTRPAHRLWFLGVRRA